MKLRASLPLIVVMSLLACLAMATAAPADTAKRGALSAKKKGAAKKRGTCHKGSAKKKGAAKKSAVKKKGAAKKKRACKGKGKKRPKNVPPKGTAAPDCGDGGAPAECFLDIWLHQGAATSGAFCSSFTNSSGSCVGSSSGTRGWNQPGYSPKYGISTSFDWTTTSGTARDVDYTAFATYTIVEAYIRGNVPSPGSSTFNVTDAYNRMSDVHWKTVSRGSDPGLQGGPLYIDYGYEIISSYVHIYGYLVRK